MRFKDKTYVMGILNATPDSFSDGGRFLNVERALKHVTEMIENGADIIDVGGESTRPQATAITAEEELERIIPIIEKISQNIEIPISIDTYKSEVAKEALNAGASIINDVWGLKYDSKMAHVAAEGKATVVVMHNQKGTIYHDLLVDIRNALADSINIAQLAGVSSDNMVIDPGFGFGKTLKQNLYLLKHLDSLTTLGLPILVGTSRKSMIGNTLNLPADQRLEGTAATMAYAITKGANIIRVHDVREMVRVARMTDAVMRVDLEEQE